MDQARSEIYLRRHQLTDDDTHAWLWIHYAILGPRQFPLEELPEEHFFGASFSLNFNTHPSRRYVVTHLGTDFDSNRTAVSFYGTRYPGNGKLQEEAGGIARVVEEINGVSFGSLREDEYCFLGDATKPSGVSRELLSLYFEPKHCLIRNTPKFRHPPETVLCVSDVQRS